MWGCVYNGCDMHIHTNSHNKNFPSYITLLSHIDFTEIPACDISIILTTASQINPVIGLCKWFNVVFSWSQYLCRLPTKGEFPATFMAESLIHVNDIAL